LGGELGADKVGWWFLMTAFVELGVIVIVVVVFVSGVDVAVV